MISTIWKEHQEALLKATTENKINENVNKVFCPFCSIPCILFLIYCNYQRKLEDIARTATSSMAEACFIADDCKTSKRRRKDHKYLHTDDDEKRVSMGSLLCKKFYDSFYIRSQTNSSSFRSYCQIQNCLSDDEVLDSDSTVDNDEIEVESEVVDNYDVVVEAVEMTSVVDGNYETATKKVNGVNSKIRFNFTKFLAFYPSH